MFGVGRCAWRSVWGSGDDDTEEPWDQAGDRQKEPLPVYAIGLSQVAREIGNVGRHRCPATRDCHHTRHDPDQP